MDCGDANAEANPLPADSPDAGYVYLSVSPAMPGFVQIGTSREDPRRLKESLQTFSGVTRFRSICSTWSSDCSGLVAQFQRALSSDQIPHHPGVFKIPIRFARQIFEDEAKAFAPAAKPSSPAPKSKAYVVVIAVAATFTAYLLFHPAHHEPAAKLAPVYRHSAPRLRM